MLRLCIMMYLASWPCHATKLAPLFKYTFIWGPKNTHLFDVNKVILKISQTHVLVGRFNLL